MKKLAWCLVAVICGCSQDPSQSMDRTSAAQAPGSLPSAQFAGSAPMGASYRGLTGRSFARMPDRGDLLEYGAASVTRQAGAYTWQSASLSEAHAMNSVVTGQMTVTAPDGTPIRMQYDHHTEHADGNWTWVGHTSDGQQGIVTFGQTAAFGSIPQGNDLAPLRLTVADGRSWVISTDRAAVRDMHSEATDPVRRDYFVPPKTAAAVASRAGSDMGSVLAPMSAKAAASGDTVDVLVGYTNGFASSLGGQAAAQTRVQYLIDVANEALLASKVGGKLRLVKSMQVNYADATDNSIALEELTGFKAPSTQTTPAAAFSALRAARDQYGADLVSLVRKFNTPENEGCGVAWLIGGNKSGISQYDEYFGYSVVSDGTDAGTDGNYYCRDETLAHELGHNMGSQHDEAAADDNPGAYDYSFGYKTAVSSGNFYTVMAYGDSGQTDYRVFSNPRISTCGSRACGTVSGADNARSLGQTLPLIATFRSAAVPFTGTFTHHDINGDGKSDILLRYYKTAPNNFGYWIMNGAGRARVGADSMGASYRIAATGDFNGDGKLDIVWAADSIRSAVMWLGNGTSWTKRSLGVYGLGWTIAGAGDLDGDGKSDLLLRYYKTAPNNFSYWIMDGATRVRTGTDSMGASYRIAATGDFNGDGKVDIVWAADSVRTALMWLSTGTSFEKRSLGTYGLGWTIDTAGDIDGDGKSDILLRYYKTAANNYSYWIMNGASRVRAGYGSVGASYRIADTGDYNGDGKLDIIWSADSIRRLYMSTGTGTSFRLLAPYGLGWTVVGE